MWKQVLAVPVVVVFVVPVVVVCAANVDRQRLLALVAAGSG